MGSECQQAPLRQGAAFWTVIGAGTIGITSESLSTALIGARGDTSIGLTHEVSCLAQTWKTRVVPAPR